MKPVNPQQEKKLAFKERLKKWARHYKIELTAIYYAMKHKETPWYAKMMAAIVVGYAFSPIDLIPDFIPIIGYLDDALLLPLGIALTIKLIPKEVLAVCREEARNKPPEKGSHRVATVVIVFIWVLLAGWAMHLFFNRK